MSLLAPEVSAKLTNLQMADDALAFRLRRLDQPCPDCAPGQKCADHAGDVTLVARYQDACNAALRDALAGADPADIDRFMPPGGDTPATVGALSVLMLARLRELAADGPVVVDLDGRPAIIELEGRNVIEHPLPDGTGSPDVA
jgi:hypothetical protein